MKKAYRHIKDFAIALFVCFLFFFLGQQIYYRFFPIQTFVEYESVTLVGEAFEGEPLTFSSVFSAAKGVELTWNDTLYCTKSGEKNFILFSSQPFARMFDKKKTLDDVSTPWSYTKPKPKAGHICYLKYGPKVTLPYGISRFYPKKVTPAFLIKKRVN